MRRVTGRQAVGGAAQARRQIKSIVAPVRGWIENENLARGKEAGASVMDNWFPTQTGARLRGGSVKVADVGSDPITSLMTYETPAVSKLFAATASTVHDVTALDPDTTAGSVIQGQAGGNYSAQQIGTVGGNFLVAVNGADVMWRYDGTEWFPCNGLAVRKLAYDGGSAAFARGETVTGAGGASATIIAVSGTAVAGTLFIGPVTSGPFVDNEALTGSVAGAATANGADAVGSSVVITGVDTSDLSFVWVAKNRLWFVEKDTMVSWYLPVDSIGGAAADFSLAGVFQKGGALLFGAAWTIDTGEGLDDKTVFVSDQGEVAIYAGTDPGNASTWALEGIFQIGTPLGANAITMKAGGDLVIATIEGLVPLSEAVRKDPAALSVSAVSRQIEPSWRAQAAARKVTLPWSVVKWQAENMAIVTLPHTGDTVYVVNLQTGAWARYVGWDARSAGIWAGRLFFGDSAGNVIEGERSGADQDIPYECNLSGLFDDLGTPGAFKQTHMMRGIFRSTINFRPKMSASSDFAITFPASPSSVNDASLSVWDAGLWDTATWNTKILSSITTRWVSVNRTGFAIAPQVQVTCGNVLKPDAEFIKADILFETGETVV